MSLGKTAKYYRNNPEARRKRLAYQAEYNKRSEQVDKRVELNRINRRSQAAGRTRKGDGKDASHTSTGIVYKSEKSNRSSRSDQPGDRRARGRKR
jgi:hypothetical protein